jgi:hypothetical protein
VDNPYPRWIVHNYKSRRITMMMTQTALHRTLRRSIMHALGNEELADKVMDSITISHPHLAQVWDENTCVGCRSILSALEKAEGRACEFCKWQVDHDKYVENLRIYGAE